MGKTLISRFYVCFFYFLFFEKIEGLTMRACPLLKGIMSEFVQGMLMTCSSNVRRLDLGDCRLVGDECVKSIGSGCVGIQELYLRNTAVSDKGLQSLTERVMYHQRLYQSNKAAQWRQGNKHKTSSGIGEKLRRLDLSGCVNVTDKGIIDISTAFQKLIELRVMTSPKVTMEGLSLRTLMLIAGQADCSFRKLSLHCGKKAGDVIDKAFLSPNWGSQLESLDLTGCGEVNDALLERLLPGCPKLKALCLHDCKVSDKSLNTISLHLPKLESLILSRSAGSLKILQKKARDRARMSISGHRRSISAGRGQPIQTHKRRSLDRSKSPNVSPCPSPLTPASPLLSARSIVSTSSEEGSMKFGSGENEDDPIVTNTPSLIPLTVTTNSDQSSSNNSFKVGGLQTQSPLAAISTLSIESIQSPVVRSTHVEETAIKQKTRHSLFKSSKSPFASNKRSQKSSFASPLKMQRKQSAAITRRVSILKQRRASQEAAKIEIPKGCSDRGLQDLFYGCPNIRRLDLSGQIEVTGSFLLSIEPPSGKVFEVQRLNLAHSGISPLWLRSVMMKFPKLEVLDISNTQISPNQLCGAVSGVYEGKRAGFWAAGVSVFAHALKRKRQFEVSPIRGTHGDTRKSISGSSSVYSSSSSSSLLTNKKSKHSLSRSASEKKTRNVLNASPLPTLRKKSLVPKELQQKHKLSFSNSSNQLPKNINSPGPRIKVPTSLTSKNGLKQNSAWSLKSSSRRKASTKTSGRSRKKSVSGQSSVYSKVSSRYNTSTELDSDQDNFEDDFEDEEERKKALCCCKCGCFAMHTCGGEDEVSMSGSLLKPLVKDILQSSRSSCGTHDEYSIPQHLAHLFPGGACVCHWKRWDVDCAKENDKRTSAWERSGSKCIMMVHTSSLRCATYQLEVFKNRQFIAAKRLQTMLPRLRNARRFRAAQKIQRWLKGLWAKQLLKKMRACSTLSRLADRFLMKPRLLRWWCHCKDEREREFRRDAAKAKLDHQRRLADANLRLQQSKIHHAEAKQQFRRASVMHTAADFLDGHLSGKNSNEPSPQVSGRKKRPGPCDRCNIRLADAFCPICRMKFCEDCCSQWHSHGNRAYHMDNLQDPTSVGSPRNALDIESAAEKLIASKDIDFGNVVSVDHKELASRFRLVLQSLIPAAEAFKERLNERISAAEEEAREIVDRGIRKLQKKVKHDLRLKKLAIIDKEDDKQKEINDKRKKRRMIMKIQAWWRGIEAFKMYNEVQQKVQEYKTITGKEMCREPLRELAQTEWTKHVMLLDRALQRKCLELNEESQFLRDQTDPILNEAYQAVVNDRDKAFEAAETHSRRLRLHNSILSAWPKKKKNTEDDDDDQKQSNEKKKEGDDTQKGDKDTKKNKNNDSDDSDFSDDFEDEDEKINNEMKNNNVDNNDNNNNDKKDIMDIDENDLEAEEGIMEYNEKGEAVLPIEVRRIIEEHKAVRAEIQLAKQGGVPLGIDKPKRGGKPNNDNAEKSSKQIEREQRREVMKRAQLRKAREANRRGTVLQFKPVSDIVSSIPKTRSVCAGRVLADRKAVQAAKEHLDICTQRLLRWQRQKNWQVLEDLDNRSMIDAFQENLNWLKSQIRHRQRALKTCKNDSADCRKEALQHRVRERFAKMNAKKGKTLPGEDEDIDTTGVKLPSGIIVPISQLLDSRADWLDRQAKKHQNKIQEFERMIDDLWKKEKDRLLIMHETLERRDADFKGLYKHQEHSDRLLHEMKIMEKGRSDGGRLDILAQGKIEMKLSVSDEERDAQRMVVDKLLKSELHSLSRCEHSLEHILSEAERFRNSFVVHVRDSTTDQMKSLVPRFKNDRVTFKYKQWRAILDSRPWVMELQAKAQSKIGAPSDVQVADEQLLYEMKMMERKRRAKEALEEREKFEAENAVSKEAERIERQGIASQAVDRVKDTNSLPLPFRVLKTVHRQLTHAARETFLMQRSITKKQRLTSPYVQGIQSVALTVGQDEFEKFTRKNEKLAEKGLDCWSRLEKNLGESCPIYIWYQRTIDPERYVAEIILGSIKKGHEHHADFSEQFYEQVSHLRMHGDAKDPRFTPLHMQMWLRSGPDTAILDFDVSLTPQDEMDLIKKGFERLEPDLNALGLVKGALWILPVDPNKPPPSGQSSLLIEVELEALAAKIRGTVTDRHPNGDASIRGLIQDLQRDIVLVKSKERLAAQDPLASTIDFLALSDQQVVEMLEVFNQIDSDGSGQVSVTEFIIGMKLRNKRFAELMFNFLDHSSDGELDFGELVHAVGTLALFGDVEMRRLCFSLFDSDGSGAITKEEIRNMFEILHSKPAEDSRLNHAIQQVLKKLGRGDEKEPEIDFNTFSELCRVYPGLIRPSFDVQKALMKTFMGTKFWTNKRHRFIKAKSKLKQEMERTNQRLARLKRPVQPPIHKKVGKMIKKLVPSFGGEDDEAAMEAKLAANESVDIKEIMEKVLKDLGPKVLKYGRPETADSVNSKRTL
eukprot:TRINITY_DN2727_c0_g1_i2.p1 TRINITY_DN2727_c0_g1~~TRINITY_DN2727_c0_g1_i2.p1  ORF type:complete len:2470 (-),score=708.50 TRINITY_DN2727_c0_g1_i2:58-7467(-)